MQKPLQVSCGPSNPFCYRNYYSSRSSFSQLMLSKTLDMTMRNILWPKVVVAQFSVTLSKGIFPLLWKYALIFLLKERHLRI